MSDLGALQDRLGVLAVAAVAELTSANVERGLRLASELAGDAFPHLFLYNPSETVAPARLRQRVSTLVLPGVLVTRGETQEAALLKLDAIRAAIDADPTLDGLARNAYVQTLGIREDPRQAEKLGDFSVAVVIEA